MLKITVVTISYNQGCYIRDCIESVLNQNYERLEYIIVDAGSTDNSREIIMEYEKKISRIVFEPDQGPADGLNKGFSFASGDIYYYLNADDTLLKESLHKINTLSMKIPGADVFLGKGWQINEDNSVERPLFPSRHWTQKKYLCGAANAIQQATFFRSTAFRKTNGFNITNRTCWDGEFLVDMAIAGASICTVNEYIGSFRIYPNSITGSGRLNQAYIKDNMRICDKIVNNQGVSCSSVSCVLMRVYDLISDPIRLYHTLVYNIFKKRVL